MINRPGEMTIEQFRNWCRAHGFVMRFDEDAKEWTISMNSTEMLDFAETVLETFVAKE